MTQLILRQESMGQLTEFITRHWILVSAFITILIALFVIEVRSRGIGDKCRLTYRQTIRLINNEKAVVIDIRDSQSYNKGHITNAVNIPATELDKHLQHLEKYKQQPIIIVCAIGKKSADFMDKLYKKRYKRVYIMIGGMSAWNNANIPVVR